MMLNNNLFVSGSTHQGDNTKCSKHVAGTRPFSNWKNSYIESISYFKISIPFQLTSKSR